MLFIRLYLLVTSPYDLCQTPGPRLNASGVYLKIGSFDPAYCRGPAFIRENTVSTLWLGSISHAFSGPPRSAGLFPEQRLIIEPSIWRVRDKRVWVNLIVLVNKLTIRGISLIVPSIYLQEQSDVHLRDYDPEIFDDDDFYHQVMTSDGVYSLRKGNANFCCAKTQDYVHRPNKIA